MSSISTGRPQSRRLSRRGAPGLFYDAMDHGDCFYIRTNAGARDFKIVVAPREAPGEENWRDVVPHRDGRFIADATLFKSYLVVLMREESRPRLHVHDLRTGEAHDIAFEEETYALDFETVYEFDTALLRFSYSSMARPEEIYDYDCATARADSRQAADDAARLRPGSLRRRASSSRRPMTASACRSRC